MLDIQRHALGAAVGAAMSAAAQDLLADLEADRFALLVTEALNGRVF